MKREAIIWDTYNILSWFTKYPCKDQKCINPFNILKITLQEETMPCTTCRSLHCPAHTEVTRREWAIRIEREIRRHPHTYSCTLPIGRVIYQDELSQLWNGFRKSISYRRKDIRYCSILEMQDDYLHMHSVIHAIEQFDSQIIKATWKKYLSKGLQISIDDARCSVKEYASPRDTAEYMMKINCHAKEIQLPPKGLWHRQIFSSTHYGR